MAKETEFACFTERTSDTISIVINKNIEKYKILRVIEFSSDRKMMSVIVVRQGDGKVFNFVKGADMAIIPRMTESSKKESGSTIELMNDYASQGLRTLMFGMKVLDSKYNGENIKDVKEEDLENEIELLGVTGLEDLL